MQRRAFNFSGNLPIRISIPVYGKDESEMVQHTGHRYLAVRDSQLKYYRRVALYCERGECGFNLYKRAETATVLLKEYFHEARELKE